MSFVEELTVYDKSGAVATPAVIINKDGVKHAGNNRFYSDYDQAGMILLATSVDGYFPWSPHAGIWQVFSVIEGHTVVGGSGATVGVVVCPGGVAIASGTAQLGAAIDLTVTAPVRQYGTIIASPTLIFPGDLVGVDMSGTLTGLVGMIAVGFKRVG